VWTAKHILRSRNTKWDNDSEPISHTNPKNECMKNDMLNASYTLNLVRAQLTVQRGLYNWKKKKT
jgi:hypothetical protein